MVRRTHIRLAPLGLLLGAAASLCGAGEDAPTIRPLTILHTNDLHARLAPDNRDRGGFARLATLIRREKAASAGALVLDAGDLVQGTPVSTIYRGLPIYELAGLLGLDVSTLGNHEFDYGWKRIREFRRTAPFAIVSANVTRGRARRLADAPSVIREVNGVRVAVIGALTADLPRLVRSEHIGPWRSEPVVDAVRREVAAVREDADLLVVLGHLNEDEEDALLSDVSEVAVVVSGHRHAGMEAPKQRDGRLLVRVKAYGRELGRLDLQVDVGNGSLAGWEWRAIPVRADIEPAPEVARAVQGWEDKVADVVDVPIGRAARHFDQDEVRALIERAMVETLDVDLAYLNHGGVRDVIPAGPLLARQIWNVMPFDNRVVVGTFRGNRIPEFLARDRAIDPEREYRIATIDYLESQWKVNGPRGLDFPEAGPDLRRLIIDWIREQQVLR
jgi:2',3'-cyclic-nucleotide 2'-phosphodiesterase (5'-nucleotidase family)